MPGHLWLKTHWNRYVDFIRINAYEKSEEQTVLNKFKEVMKKPQISPIHAVNTMANSGNTAYGVGSFAYPNPKLSDGLVDTC